MITTVAPAPPAAASRKLGLNTIEVGSGTVQPPPVPEQEDRGEDQQERGPEAGPAA